ncbi:VapE domain-containing protein [Corynebacterium casei]|uniref:VapE domain-containing protein n=1 Tax=Corynebacterium casei TaxID=160386 RepID=UPI003FD1181C
MTTRELAISTAPSRTSIQWTNARTDQLALLEKAYNPVVIDATTAEYHALPKAKKDELKDVGGYVSGHLRHGRRKKGHVHLKSFLTLDIDNLPAAVHLPDVLQQRLPCNWLTHTTLSHTAQEPRWRIWVFTNEDMNPDKYEAVARRVAEDINPGLTWFDATTFQPERFMYWPAATSDADNYQVATADGQPDLDVEATLARYADWTDLSCWPGVDASQLTHLDVNDKNAAASPLGDPGDKPGMLGAFNRAYSVPQAITAFLRDVYKPGQNGRYTYTGGSSSNGLIVYNSGKYAFSQHATDAANDGHSHSAFDLVRIHKYGHLDEEAKPKTPANKMPSYVAMTDFILEDEATRKENAAATAEKLSELFQPIVGAETAEEGEQQEDESDVKDPLAWLAEMDFIGNTDKFKDTFENFQRIFTHDPRLNHIAWNEHANRLEVRDPQALPWKQLTPGWSENDDAQLKTTIANNYTGIYAPTKMHDALLAVASKRAFHPVRDYFNQLPEWDGIERVDTLLVDVLGADDTEYTRAVTRKTLAAAVRRTFRPGTKFDTVLTLVGPQGIGKSTIFARLAGQWFSDSLTITDMKNKDAAEKLDGNLIVEISELAGMRKAEAEPVKGFISRTEDKYRPAYGRTVQTYPRQCVIVGSTNAEDGFLRDPTGGRRWWPVHVQGQTSTRAHDLDQEVIDQIWAEAKHYEQNGEELYLTGVLESAALDVQADSIEADDRTGLVVEYLEKPLPKSWDVLPLGIRRIYLDGGQVPEQYNNVTAFCGQTYVERDSVSKIEIWSECFGRDPDQMKRMDSYEISSIMAQIDGWQDSGKRRRLPIYGQQRVYERVEQSALADAA